MMPCQTGFGNVLAQTPGKRTYLYTDEPMIMAVFGVQPAHDMVRLSNAEVIEIANVTLSDGYASLRYAWTQAIR